MSPGGCVFRLIEMVPNRQARVSLIAFAAPIPFVFIYQGLVQWVLYPWGQNAFEAALALVFFALLAILWILVGKLGLKDEPGKNSAYISSPAMCNDFRIWWRSVLISWVTSTGCHICVDPALQTYMQFGCYLLFLSFFHWTEYMATALTNPSNLSTDSFLLNHSPAYHAAAVISWLEFFVESYFAPALKAISVVTYLGMAVCMAGEAVRKLAMYHAGKSFNHIVQSTKREDHTLITHGVFRFVRHPSYVGWFYWSIGTQLILVNPVCVVAYTVVSWLFFADRVQVEECSLISFFGEDYLNYMKRVPTGLPFIQGYPVEVHNTQEEN